jgi:tyrosinase
MLRFSRRFVLAATTALAAVPFAEWAGATPAPYAGLRTRHNAASAEGKAMLAKFARAIERMRRRPVGDPLSWNFQWYTHWVPDNTTKAAEISHLPEDEQPLARELWNTCRAHDKESDESLFLPWHRAYLFYFERIVRKVLSDDDFALPYWDFTDPDHRALPPEFLTPADASNALYAVNRRAEVNAGRPIDWQYQVNSPINADALKQEAYGANDVTQGLCMALDKGVHGAVHVLIGNAKGMGSVQWSANDPIFWLLHAELDRLWITWLKGGRENPGDESWANAEFAFVDENGRRVTMRVRDCLDHERLGYRYDRLATTLVAVETGPVPEDVGAAPEAADEAAAPPPPPGAEGGNRAAPPATAAAPLRRAQAPPTHAAAPVQSHGPARLGRSPVQVTLTDVRPQQQQLPATGAAPPDAGGGEDRAPAPPAAPPLQAQAPRPSRLYIVIRNLQAKAQPGVLYDVYVKVSAAGQTASARLGSINFFDAVGHNHAPGMTMQNSFVSFEVTGALALARAPGAKLEVTIAPVGQPATNAAPVVGSISLVEKPV